jgi:hypothetical protein
VLPYERGFDIDNPHDWASSSHVPSDRRGRPVRLSPSPLQSRWNRPTSGLYEGRVIPLVLPHERGFDIDNPHDWEIVEEFLMSRQIARGERPA